MTITIYECNDDFRVMDKTMTAVQEITGVELYGSCSVAKPVFRISTAKSNIPDGNYVYCPTFKRYYHITDMVAEPGGAVLIYCCVDVRYSWKEAMRQLPCSVLRNEGIGKPTMIVDTELPIEQGRERIISQVLPTFFVEPYTQQDEYTYILITR